MIFNMNANGIPLVWVVFFWFFNGFGLWVLYSGTTLVQRIIGFTPVLLSSRRRLFSLAAAALAMPVRSPSWCAVPNGMHPAPSAGWGSQAFILSLSLCAGPGRGFVWNAIDLGSNSKCDRHFLILGKSLIIPVLHFWTGESHPFTCKSQEYNQFAGMFRGWQDWISALKM